MPKIPYYNFKNKNLRHSTIAAVPLDSAGGGRHRRAVIYQLANEKGHLLLVLLQGDG